MESAGVHGASEPAGRPSRRRWGPRGRLFVCALLALSLACRQRAEGGRLARRLANPSDPDEAGAEPQLAAVSRSAPPLPAESGSGTGEELYVTCPSDYEDAVGQPAIESASGLSVEQQHQLLAGVDSSGLLAGGAPTNASLEHEDSQQVAPGQRPPANQCIHAGSRMIEVITKVITPILFSIIIVVGLLGNIIVMLVILEDRKTERELTPTNLLILDLSLADLSFIIFCIPFTGWDYSVGHWVFGLLWCKFNQYLIVVCALSSIYTLVLMSVDRFMAIVYPIECIEYRTSQNTLHAIYVKWILILLMASPTIPMHGLIDSPLEPDQFTCRFLADQYNPLHFQIVFFVTSYLFPLILIFCLYLSLLNKLWFGSRPHGHKESLKMLESKKRVTWLVAGIVVVFALCWCPIQVMLILMRLKSHRITATYVAVQVFAHTLGYMNSCVNPIVYAFASETFHNSFKRSSFGRLCCLAERGSDLDGRSSSRTNQTHTNVTLLNHQRHSLSAAAEEGRNGACSNSAPAAFLRRTGQTLVALPLEPRDRPAPPPPIAVPGPPQWPTEPDARPGRSVSSTEVQPPKQQLVARVVQPGSQLIAHRCEPAYQRQLIAP